LQGLYKKAIYVLLNGFYHQSDRIAEQFFGIPKEIHPGEKRVATTPEVAEKIIQLGFQVSVESGAGQQANISDEAYKEVVCSIRKTAQYWPSSLKRPVFATWINVAHNPLLAQWLVYPPVFAEVAEKIIQLGFQVSVESGAGQQANISDEAYKEVGCSIRKTAQTLWKNADIVIKVRPPEFHPELAIDETELLSKGGHLISFIWLSICSLTSGRVSKARTIAPILLAAPMAAKPATPAPITSIFAGKTLPAAVIWPVKNRSKCCAASITAR
jgi:NAD/NADP transhydrogenase alpha subunit